MKNIIQKSWKRIAVTVPILFGSFYGLYSCFMHEVIEPKVELMVMKESRKIENDLAHNQEKGNEYILGRIDSIEDEIKTIKPKINSLEFRLLLIANKKGLFFGRFAIAKYNMNIYN